MTDNPIGPGGSVLVAGSTMAGMIFGLGIVFLVAPGPTEGHGRRRWTDYLTGYGRRASDAFAPDMHPVAAAAPTHQSEWSNAANSVIDRPIGFASS